MSLLKISQCPNMQGKRLLKEDSYGCGSIPKLKRCRIDSIRYYPTYCGPLGSKDDDENISDGIEDRETEAEEYHSFNSRSNFGTMSMNDSMESKCKIIQNRGNYVRHDDCMVINQGKRPKKWEFEWVEVDDNMIDVKGYVQDDECMIINQVKMHKGCDFDWVEVDDSEIDVDELKYSSNVRDNAAKDIGFRNKVLEVLNIYRDLYTKLFLKEEKEMNVGRRTQVHVKAAMILRKQNKWLNCKETVGHVHGVNIGDRFQFRAELVVVGLHDKFIRGISYATIGDTLYAVSVVDSGRYENKVKSPNVLIYSGHGGNPLVNSDSKDQVLKEGNLALKNSMDAKIPVRVIRKVEEEAKKKIYFYDGLYNVIKFWPERSDLGTIVYMFEMVRIKGQPECNHLDIIGKQSMAM